VRFWLVILFLGVSFTKGLSQSVSSKTDSVKKDTTSISADSLAKRTKYKLDSASKRINFKIDSLNKKGLPTAHYQKKLDSINLCVQNLMSLTALSKKVNNKISASLKSREDSLQKKFNKKTGKLQRKIKKKTHSIDSLTAKAKDPGQVKVGKADAAFNSKIQKDAKLPGVGGGSGVNVNTAIPGAVTSKEASELQQAGKNLSLPQIKEVQRAEAELKKVENLPKQEINELKNNKEVSEIKNEAKEVTKLEKQTEEYKKQIKEVKKLDKSSVDSLAKSSEKDIEKIAGSSSYAKELSKETSVITTQKNALEQYKDMLTDFKKQVGVRDVKDISTKQLSNPFVGQEMKLKAGVAELDKLKAKYHTITTDSRGLMKRVRNEMYGRPFKERIIPGLGFQWYPGKQVGVDLTSYLMYRITGRWRMGLGYSDRLVFDDKNWNVSSGHVQAIRVMTDYRLLPTLHLHVEEEWTHYDLNAQNIYRTITDPPLKEWNVKLNAGVLKGYKISRRINGQMQLLYNTLDWSNFPQSKNTAMRFGFEYKFGVKKTKPSK
jgi:hypothetical protein